MVLVLCAVVRPETPSEGLERLDRGAVSVLYETRERAPRAERDELLRFGDVVQLVTRMGAALPFRFGTVVEDQASLEALAADREVGWGRRLDVVSGHVELVVHAGEPVPHLPSSGSGRDYLMARAAVHRHAEEVFTAVLRAVEGVSRETRLLRGRDETRLACLVPVGAEQRLRTAVQQWADERQGRDVLVTGPWPPFSFTEVPADSPTDDREVPV